MTTKAAKTGPATRATAKPSAKTPTEKVEPEVMAFESAAAFERWLEGASELTQGIWLKLAKKGSGVASVTYAEAVDVGLCHGWIDGQAKSVDATYYMQRFTPRRKNSVWSKINIGKVAVLIANGRMRPGGLAEIERAKADGRWAAAYDGPATMDVPAELVVALEGSPQAKALFESLDKTNRYALCFRVHTAVKPATKASRVAKVIEMLETGELPYPVKSSKTKITS
jgi:uncharacterized protein YdeI (YjbR/CyaY-like superfamily)